jgi:hypothetical protein
VSATARAGTSRAGAATAWAGPSRGPTRTGRPVPGSGSAWPPASRSRRAWEAEKPFSRPLPGWLTEPFDLVKPASVHKDCTVHFEGRSSAVPFLVAGCAVEVRGCSGCVQILDPQTATVLISYPRHTQQRILIDPTCYEGPGTAEVLSPKPQGRMARKLQEIAALPVERRPVDLYAALAEVAR